MAFKRPRVQFSSAPPEYFRESAKGSLFSCQPACAVTGRAATARFLPVLFEWHKGPQRMPCVGYMLGRSQTTKEFLMNLPQGGIADRLIFGGDGNGSSNTLQASSKLTLRLA